MNFLIGFVSIYVHRRNIFFLIADDYRTSSNKIINRPGQVFR